MGEFNSLLLCPKQTSKHILSQVATLPTEEKEKLISELLKDISDKGGRHFLVSHRNDQVLELLAKTQIVNYFTEVVTASSGFKRKPDPESMIYLRDKYHITSGLVIGDRNIDIEAGEAAGLDAYLFKNVATLRQAIDM